MANTPMTQRKATCWSLTINNPKESDEECVNRARQKGWRVKGQKEKGEEGTIHYQIMLNTPHIRFSAVKKTFPRAHIEVARDPIRLANYVQKEETRVGELLKDDSMYPTMSKVWHLLALYVDESDEGRKGGYLDWNPEKWLRVWDGFIGDTIRDGLYVEHLGANPQNRSIVKLYGCDIVTRELLRASKNLDEEIVEVEAYPDANEDDEEEDASSQAQLPAQGTCPS